MEKPRTAGRPRKDGPEAKSDFLDVRVSGPEKEAFRDAAELAGIPLATWVRERLRRAARIELEDAGRQAAFLRSPLARRA